MSRTCTLQKYLIKVSDKKIILEPIIRAPNINNFYLVEVIETLKYNQTKNAFLPVNVTGTVTIHKGEFTKVLGTFRGKSSDNVLNSVKDFIKELL